MKLNKTIACALLSVATFFATTQALAQQYPRDPAARARYHDARQQAARYAAEAARYNAEYRALRQSDRYFRPIRRAADGAIRYGSRAAGVPGRVIDRVYRSTRNRLSGNGR